MLIYAMASGYQESKSAAYINALLAARHYIFLEGCGLASLMDAIPCSERARQGPQGSCVSPRFKRWTRCANVHRKTVTRLLWRWCWDHFTLQRSPERKGGVRSMSATTLSDMSCPNAAYDSRPFVHLQLADPSASPLELRMAPEDAGTYSSTDRQQTMTVCWRIHIAQACL